MSHDRHAELKRIFDELATLDPGAERDARLRELCGADAGLAAEVEKLLRFDQDDDDVFLGAALHADLSALWEDEETILEGGDAMDPTRYEIVRPLGQGGFGTVYLANEKEPIPRPVAIKVIKPGMDTREILARFDSERRALATMDHPAIARVFAAGADQRGHPYFVMEYVEGQPITQFCDEHRLDLSARLELFVVVCDAIQHAHYKGIVHRDVKPGNVLVALIDGRPTPKVIDFGIAKATGEQARGNRADLTFEGQFVGTPLAMSPEQARGTVEIDTRADVYGLGGLVYELLCGEPPFAAEGDSTDLAELRQRILEEDPPRPSARLPRNPALLAELAARRGVEPRALVQGLANDLDWIVMRALEKEPSRRYSSARDLALDVERYLADQPISARPPSRTYQMAKFARRHRAGLAAAAIMLALLIAGTVGTAVGWRRSIRALQEARHQEALARTNLERASRAEAEARREALRAEAEAELARGINTFLNEDLLFAVSPESLGFDVSMRRTLDVAATRIKDRFDKHPRIERGIRTTLGRTYRTLSLPRQAEEQLQLALATLPKDSGAPEAEDPTLVRERALVMKELAQVRLQQNRNAEAEGMLRETWEECSENLGDLDPVTIDALHFLGVSLAEQLRFEEAAEAFEASGASALAAVGEEHELSIQSLHSRGLLRLGRAQVERRPPDEETQRLLQEALSASRSLHGSDDPRTIRRIIDVAAVLSMRGDDETSIAMYEEAEERSRRVQGPGHPTTATSLLAIGFHHLSSGSTSEAAAILEEAYEATMLLGEAHPILVRARFQLAVCRLQQNRLEEAEELALAAFDVIERGLVAPATLGSGPVDLAEILAEICRRERRDEEAATWRQVARELAEHH